MPAVDMPLDELRRYTGRNPRPEDFDEYWDRALAEMANTEPDLELKPALFQCDAAECFHLYFTGVRGARVHAKYLRPRRGAPRHPAVLEFHGYSGNSGDWTTKLHWVSEGLSVFSLDCRGQGGLSQDVGGVRGTTLRGHIIRGLDDDPDNLLFRQIFLDTARLAAIAMEMPEVDPDRVGATGGSQGGGLTLACGALTPRIKRLAPVYPFLSDYKRVWEMDLGQRAYEEIGEFFRRFDPTHHREEELFRRLGYIDVQHLASRVKGEVLMGTGLRDETCPPSTQFAAYNRITSRKQVEVYPDFGHESLPGHSDKVFQFLREL